MGPEEVHRARVHGRRSRDLYHRAGWQDRARVPQGIARRTRARDLRGAEAIEDGRRSEVEAIHMAQGKCAFCGTFVTSGGTSLGKHSVACTACTPMAQKWL